MVGNQDIPRDYRAMLPRLRKRRVGLVLCGGGFKGAYQIGVWKALRDKRIGIKRFHAISGTSVGALNAVLIANGDVKDADTVWCAPDLLKLSVRGAGAYLHGYALLLGPLLVSALALGVAFAGTQAESNFLNTNALRDASLFLLFLVGMVVVPYLLDHGARYVTRWFFIVPIIYFLTAAIGAAVGQLLPSAPPWLAGSVSLLGAMAAMTAQGFSLDDKRPPLFFVEAQPLFATACGAVAGALAAGSGLLASAGVQDIDIWGTLGGAVVALVVGLPAGSACGSAAKTVLGRAHQTGRLLSNANLLEILQGRLSLRRIRARTTVLAVTIAEYLQVLEPFRVRLDRGADPRLRHRNPDEPGFHLQWYARYLNLCDLDDDGAALELLRQTSALPLLVESGVTESGGSSVDGGVADNMPLWPVCAAGAEYVIVVDLNARPQRFTYYSEHLKKTWMAQLLADMPEAQATSLYREWFRRWEADKRADGADLLPEAPTLREDQLIILKPSKALATIDWPVLRFLTGTLNLSQRARATWMELGFEDTLRAFGVKVTANAADS